MAELDQVNQYEFVKLVNRTAEPAEFIYDGVRFDFKPNGSRTVPAFVAKHVYTTNHSKIHTTDGDYLYRFGIDLDGCPEQLLGLLPAEAFETGAIERDTQAVEGWDTSGVPGRVVTQPVRAVRSDYMNQGNAAGASMGAPAAVLREGR